MQKLSVATFTLLSFLSTAGCRTSPSEPTPQKSDATTIEVVPGENKGVTTENNGDQIIAVENKGGDGKKTPGGFEGSGGNTMPDFSVDQDFYVQYDMHVVELTTNRAGKADTKTADGSLRFSKEAVMSASNGHMFATRALDTSVWTAPSPQTADQFSPSILSGFLIGIQIATDQSGDPVFTMQLKASPSGSDAADAVSKEVSDKFRYGRYLTANISAERSPAGGRVKLDLNARCLCHFQ